MSPSFHARILDDPYVGAHATVIVFAGPDPEHRANVGQLVMRYEEADALVALFEMLPVLDSVRLHYESSDTYLSQYVPHHPGRLWDQRITSPTNGATLHELAQEWAATESENARPGHVSDGFGSVWQRCAPEGICTLEVVRPGKVQCIDLVSAMNGVTESHCDTLGRPRP